MKQTGSVTVRGVEIGSGIPKICVPVMGKTETEVLASAEAARACAPDVVEWRIDWLARPGDSPAVHDLLRKLREFFGATPLLATFRSKREGGEQELSLQNYVNLLTGIIRTGMTDLVDVELFSGAEAVTQIVQTAHRHGVAVIGSSHEFHSTPDEFTLINRMELMQVMGCDIAKVAVMPQCPRDVLTLLSVTEQMKTRHPELPIITMSMGKLGMVSRLCGEIFGSALTFGSAGQSSAPGQVAVKQLRDTLELLHH